MPIKTNKCEKCSFEIRDYIFQKHTEKCDGRGPRSKRPTGVCRLCGGIFPPKQLGSHVINCELYPESLKERRRERLSRAGTGKKLSEDTKKKLSDKVNKKILEGTWHLSFSKSRTHNYCGINFHGSWEVKYAMHLDKLGIKWRRPTEKFPYTFDEKLRYYTPDFYLIDENTYVEIKGYKTPKDEAKWKCFPTNLRILRGEDLIQLGILDVECVKVTDIVK